MLKRFAEIIKADKLEGQVVLVGSFCMERCGEGMNWKFNDEAFTSESVEQAEDTLRSKLVEVAKRT